MAERPPALDEDSAVTESGGQPAAPESTGRESTAPAPATPGSTVAGDDTFGTPDVPDEVSADDLDRDVRYELRALGRTVATRVARHLVAAGRLLADEPEEALGHALAARRLAPRIAAVRESAGLAAYRAGEWQTAIAELRTYHRLTGRQSHIAEIADSERALGRPERAIDLFRRTDRGDLAPPEWLELLIVAAGARADLGQHDAAAAMLQVSELTRPDTPGRARLMYAYADALLGADRPDEAREWFARAAEADDELTTDAAERLLELDGVVLDDTELDFDDLPDPDRWGDLAGGPAEVGDRIDPDRAADREPTDADADADRDPAGDAGDAGEGTGRRDGPGADPAPGEDAGGDGGDRGYPDRPR